MRHFHVPENLIQIAITALRAEAHTEAGHNPEVVEEYTPEFHAAEQLEKILAHPVIKHQQHAHHI